MGDLTFLMNSDPSGASNQFYSLAKQYFVAAGATVIDAPAGGQTLEGVFTRLKTETKEQKTINLVSHANGFAAMECPVTVPAQQHGRRTITADDLQDVLAAKSLAPPGPAVITANTRIVIYGCDVGRSLRFMTMLSGLFGDPGAAPRPARRGAGRRGLAGGRRRAPRRRAPGRRDGGPRHGCAGGAAGDRRSRESGASARGADLMPNKLLVTAGNWQTTKVSCTFAVTANGKALAAADPSQQLFDIPAGTTDVQVTATPTPAPNPYWPTTINLVVATTGSISPKADSSTRVTMTAATGTTSGVTQATVKMSRFRDVTTRVFDLLKTIPIPRGERAPPEAELKGTYLTWPLADWSVKPAPDAHFLD